MPPLKSFLTMGITKRIDSHRYACSVLGLNTDGKAVILRSNLLAYAKGSEEKEEKVKELITHFVENDGVVNTQSQHLFSQSDSDSDTENEHEQ